MALCRGQGPGWRVQARAIYALPSSNASSHHAVCPFALFVTPARTRPPPARLERVWFLAHGWVYSSKGYGRWGPAAGEEGTLSIHMCNMQLRATPTFGTEAWTLSANGETMAWLQASDDAARVWRSAESTEPKSELGRRIVGTGPYQGSKHGTLMLLRNGVLWAVGKYDKYRQWREIEGGGGETVELIGGGRPVLVRFTDCFVMRFVEATAEPVTAAVAPPKYGSGVTAESAEWILRPDATTCRDVCTVRPVRPEPTQSSRRRPRLQNMGGLGSLSGTCARTRRVGRA